MLYSVTHTLKKVPMVHTYIGAKDGHLRLVFSNFFQQWRNRRSGFFIATLKETSKNKVGGRSCCFNYICLQNIATEPSSSARKKLLNSVNN